jgi:hypothetical protein|tara:strand:+ start:1595 stop:1906 length:312 start_codon:yes stop_codon:yes gene_type:complete
MSHRSNVGLARAKLPRPTAGIVDDRYVQQLVRALEELIDTVDATQHREVSDLTITDINTEGSHLRIGDVFEDSGILKIVRAGDAFAGTLVGTSAVGTVTVLTP